MNSHDLIPRINFHTAEISPQLPNSDILRNDLPGLHVDAPQT